LAALCAGLSVVVCLAAGCGGGGTLDPEALAKEVEAVESLAAEGALLADGVTRARTAPPFTRTHAEELAQTATEETKKLESAQVPSGLQAKAREAAVLSARVGRLLTTLGEAPDDRVTAQDLEKRLSAAAEAAKKLAASL